MFPVEKNHEAFEQIYGLRFSRDVLLFLGFLEATGNGWEVLGSEAEISVDSNCCAGFLAQEVPPASIRLRFGDILSSVDPTPDFLKLFGKLSGEAFILYDFRQEKFSKIVVCDQYKFGPIYENAFQFLRNYLEECIDSLSYTDNFFETLNDFYDRTEGNVFEDPEGPLLDLSAQLRDLLSYCKMVSDIDAFCDEFDLDCGDDELKGYIPSRWRHFEDGWYVDGLDLILSPDLYPDAKYTPSPGECGDDEQWSQEHLAAASGEALSLCGEGYPGPALDLGRYLWGRVALAKKKAKKWYWETACKLLRAAYERLGSTGPLRNLEAFEGDGVLYPVAADFQALEPAVDSAEGDKDPSPPLRWNPAPPVPMLDYLRQLLWSGEEASLDTAIGGFAFVLAYLDIKRSRPSAVPELEESPEEMGVYYRVADIAETLESLCREPGCEVTAQIIASELLRRVEAGFGTSEMADRYSSEVIRAIAVFPALEREGPRLDWSFGGESPSSPIPEASGEAIETAGRSSAEFDPKTHLLENLENEEDWATFRRRCEDIARLRLMEAVPKLRRILDGLDPGPESLAGFKANGVGDEVLTRAEAVAEALADLGDPSGLQPLLRFVRKVPDDLLKGPWGVPFRNAVQQLSGGEAVLDDLVELADHQGPVQATAVAALLEFGGEPPAAEALLRFLERAARQDTPEWLDKVDAENFEAAKGWLQEKAADLEEAVPWPCRTVFIVALRLLDTEDRAIVPTIRNLIQEGALESLQKALILALGESGSGEAVGVLLDIEGERNDWVALEALGRSRNPRAVPALVEFIRTHPDYRSWVGCEVAGEALARIGSRDCAAQLAELVEASPPNRNAAIVLGSWGDRRAFDLLIAMLAEGPADLRARAATALGEVGDPEAVPALVRLAVEYGPEHDDAFVGLRAREAAARLVEFRIIDGEGRAVTGLQDEKFDMLRRVIVWVLCAQEPFWSLQGEIPARRLLPIKPLTRAQVADGIGVDSSTITRTLGDLRVWLPWGRREIDLEFLLSPPVKGEGGDVARSSAVVVLHTILAQEPSATDTDLGGILESRFGVRVARRTVAKYRGLVGEVLAQLGETAEAIPSQQDATAPSTEADVFGDEEWRYLEYRDDKTKKFWMASVDGENLKLRWGRIGTPGQDRDLAFPSPDGAREERDKRVHEKLKKGYVDAEMPFSADDPTPSTPPAVPEAGSLPREFSAVARQLRESAGWTQAQVAEAVGLDAGPSLWSKYEGGHSLPNLDVAMKIARAFGVSVSELAGRPRPEISRLPRTIQALECAASETSGAQREAVMSRLREWSHSGEMPGTAGEGLGPDAAGGEAVPEIQDLDRQALAQRLVWLREHRRLSKSQLNRDKSVQGSWYKYEEGTTVPSLPSATVIADRLGVSLDALCGLVPYEPLCEAKLIQKFREATSGLPPAQVAVFDRRMGVWLEGALHELPLEKKAPPRDKQGERAPEPAGAEPPPIPREVVESAKAAARKAWPDDFVEQKRQVEASLSTWRWMTEHRDPRIPREVLESLRARVRERWPVDFEKQKEEFEVQVQAYLDLLAL